MLEEKEVREECLYCHGQIKPRDPCPFCGDDKACGVSEALIRQLRPTSMFHYPGPILTRRIAGV